MNNALPKRGRPPKRSDRLKADYLDIRLLAVEKKAFRDAADLAGLDLSSWVRERLRMLARRELEVAGQPVAFLTVPPDHVSAAHYVRPCRLFLRFKDGFNGTWTFEQLGLDMSNMKPTTVKASPSGSYIEVKSKWGDDVQLDGSSLRYRVDPKYAHEIDNKLDMLATQIGL
jgi:hypothetical protein